MSDMNHAFQVAILEEPSEPVHRGAYADWLEDLGDLSRSSLVRLGSIETPLGIEMIPVGKGKFWTGKFNNDKVQIAKPFYMGKYPVTQSQWQAIMGNNPSYFCRKGDGKDKVKGISDADLASFPVEQISFNDVTKFIAKLNQKEVGQGWEYRLPTSEEWEYACRGGHTIKTKDDCYYDFYLDRPTNDLSSTQANFDGNYPEGKGKIGPYLNRTSKVGSYPANSLGIHDMHGNVWERTSTKMDRFMVYRGGSWFNFGQYCRAAYEDTNDPENRYLNVGFRLARVLQ